MTNRQKAAMETRRRLLETAKQMIAEQGFCHVSIDDIVKACGVARGTFYTYFKNKEDIVQAISRQPFSDIEAEMEKIKTTFLAILKDIKKGLESEQPTSPPIQMQVFQAILQTAGSAVAVPPDLDAFLGKLIAIMRQTCSMSDESARLFKALFQSMIAGKAASQPTQA